jgi:hypothetical protein
MNWANYNFNSDREMTIFVKLKKSAFPKKRIMYTTYHLNSAQELNTDILDAIKAAFKSKPITIIVKVDEDDGELTEDMKTILDERVLEDEQTYLSANDAIDQLAKKYGL